MDDLISRSALLAAYDKAHQGPPGGARKLIEEAPDAIVRCKDCVHRGNAKKCIVAFVAKEQDFPLFFDNHGYWFCADGKPKEFT